MRAPSRPFATLAGIAAIQGLVLVGYAGFDLISAIRYGIQGPSEVSNPPAVALQILIFALFGAGLLLVASGWWRMRRWARAPFLLVQLLAIVVGIPLAQAGGAVERATGMVTVAVAIAGGVIALLPAVGRVLDPPGRP